MSAFTRRALVVASSALALLACHREQVQKGDAGAGQEGFIVRDGRGLSGEALAFGVLGARIVAASEMPSSSPVLELGGRFVVPAFIDSHTHLSYYAVADVLPLGGVVGAVDFAAPIASLALSYPIAVRRSGPMLTSVAGYPTQSWGSGGYGLELASAAEATLAVDQLLDAGADFIKVPLMASVGLPDDALAAVVARAHERGVRVAAHAVSAIDAQRAVESKVDILAHTPTEVLPEAVVRGFGERTLISTLAAFGGTAAYDNLRALREHGARVLYGTDLGNTREASIQAGELQGLLAAGLSGAEIVRAATSDAAAFWGFDELGSLEPGKSASFLVLDEDPSANPMILTKAHTTVWAGKVVAGEWP